MIEQVSSKKYIQELATDPALVLGGSYHLDETRTRTDSHPRLIQILHKTAARMLVVQSFWQFFHFCSSLGVRMGGHFLTVQCNNHLR